MALKNLVRTGHPPRPRRKKCPVIDPISVDSVTWFYPMPKGMAVVHEVRDHDRYIRTDEFTIKWKDVRMGLELGKAVKKAMKPQPAIAPRR